MTTAIIHDSPTLVTPSIHWVLQKASAMVVWGLFLHGFRRFAKLQQLLIDIATPGGRQSGLLHTSAVKCEHLITLHQRFVERVIGRLHPDLMNKIDRCLKASLDLR